jgi:hypothetical protein
VPAKRLVQIATRSTHSDVAYASPGFWAQQAEPCNRRVPFL